MEPRTQYNLLWIWQGYLPFSHYAFEASLSYKNFTVENTILGKIV